jgi:putative SOS response-associated peptidase YedK
MCNRYEQNGSVSRMRQLGLDLGRKLATSPATGNLAPQDSIYPDQDAPIIVNAEDGGLELIMARWGFPPIPGEKAPITNIRNLKSKWWRDLNREWLIEPAYRCLVPFTAFAEPARDSTWFQVPGAEVATFAGIWRPWHGERLAEQPGQKRRA